MHRFFGSFTGVLAALGAFTGALAETETLEERVVLAQLNPGIEGAELNLAEHSGSESESLPKQGTSATADSPERQPSWIDSGHGFVTSRADDLTQWFDAYFGGGDQEDTGAYSRLRLRLIEDWDQRLGNDVRLRIGGKVNLPEISKRLDLVFQGDDPLNEINGGDDPSQSRVALELKLNPLEELGFDFRLTLGASSNGPKPGLKFTLDKDLSERNTLRFIERIQYDFGEGTTSTSRLLLDHQIDEQQLLRSYTRLLYGAEADGLEWSTAVQWINFWDADRIEGEPNERGLMAYTEVWGATEPYQYVSNYRVGVRYRRQTYRKYLFVELEPSYNWRVDEPFDQRAGAWKIELRFELLLFEDLREDRP